MKKIILVSLLLVPAIIGASVYFTKRGDTLQTVANATGMTVSQLAQANPNLRVVSGQAVNYTISTPPTSPTPPPPTPTPPPTGICMNYGHQPLVGGQYDPTQVANDLNYLKARGITCIRTADYGTNSTLSEGLALYAHLQGFYVEIGNDGDPTSSGYAQGVINEAKWAQANGIDQMSIGNEADNGGANQSLLASLSCQIRQVYSGIISYDTYKGSYDPITSWHNNMGCLDKLGLNIYADYSNTMSEAQTVLGSHFYVSETNLDCSYNSQCSDDTIWASKLQNILNIEKPYGVKLFVFAYRSGGDGTPFYWGVFGHPTVMSILGL